MPGLLARFLRGFFYVLLGSALLLLDTAIFDLRDAYYGPTYDFANFLKISTLTNDPSRYRLALPNKILASYYFVGAAAALAFASTVLALFWPRLAARLWSVTPLAALAIAAYISVVLLNPGDTYDKASDQAKNAYDTIVPLTALIVIVSVVSLAAGAIAVSRMARKQVAIERPTPLKQQRYRPIVAAGTIAVLVFVVWLVASPKQSADGAAKAAAARQSEIKLVKETQFPDVILETDRRDGLKIDNASKPQGENPAASRRPSDDELQPSDASATAQKADMASGAGTFVVQAEGKSFADWAREGSDGLPSKPTPNEPAQPTTVEPAPVERAPETQIEPPAASSEPESAPAPPSQPQAQTSPPPLEQVQTPPPPQPQVQTSPPPSQQIQTPRPPATPAPDPQVAKMAEFAQAWTSIQATSSEAILNAFISRASGTIYEDLARARRDEVRHQAAAAKAVEPTPSLPPASAPKPDSESAIVDPPTCEALWYQRNALFHKFGYCFSAKKGISVFGNTGCYRNHDGAWAAMGGRDKDLINRITALERSKNC